MGHEPSTVNNRSSNELFDYILYVLGISHCQSSKVSQFQVSKFQCQKLKNPKFSKFQISKRPKTKEMTTLQIINFQSVRNTPFQVSQTLRWSYLQKCFFRKWFGIVSCVFGSTCTTLSAGACYCTLHVGIPSSGWVVVQLKKTRASSCCFSSCSCPSEYPDTGYSLLS